jgi:pyridoxal phosphate enzyme (YggS family)
MSIASRLNQIKCELPENVRLVAVSKFQEVPVIQEAYDAGKRIFGESRVQELMQKYEQLPQDIEWHLIGHLQINKVKYIAPFIGLIHSVDSLKLLKELNKFAEKLKRKINVLLQVHIAQEEHKFGFSPEELQGLLKNKSLDNFPHLTIAGLMGMASFTENQTQIRKEFAKLSALFQEIKKEYFSDNADFKELSMGMSDDYLIAIEEGSTLIRVGSKLFEERS